MEKQCIYIAADGRTCPNKAETGLFCAEHVPAKSDEKPAAAARTDKPSGGGGGGGWNVIGRAGVVYQKK